jgi:MoxR-like ATPase
MSNAQPAMLRAPAEVTYAHELAALASVDSGDKPAGWKLSPKAVVTFICGSQLKGGKSKAAKSDTVAITRKFHGDDRLVERAVIGLAGSRALMLVGEPGTAKSLLSELLAAAITGHSLNVVQGTAATTDDQIRYSWNYALLLAEGPSSRALVPSPIYAAMKQGQLVRFEEITRCPPEIQDTLVSILSEKMMPIPELKGDDGFVFAKPGFNVIATANVRDRGVHEMSSALKRRFNFETVQPIRDAASEVSLVQGEVNRLLKDSNAPTQVDRDVVEMLVTIFHDLRSGQTPEGVAVEKPTAVMSTAEAVSVGLASALDAWYYGDKKLTPAELGRHVPGAVLKESADDVKKFRQYLTAVIKRRADGGSDSWGQFHESAVSVVGKKDASGA